MCPKCGRKIRLRKDGKIPQHTIEMRRGYRRRGQSAWKVDRCPASGTIANQVEQEK